MKKILAIALTLTLVFALCLSASAALPSGWVTTSYGGASEANAIVNADGSLTLTWGNPEVYYANLGAGLDVSVFNNNYTATVEVFVPEMYMLGGSTFATGFSLVGVKVTTLSADPGWLTGCIMKLTNYEGHPAGTPDNFAAWGGTYNVFECWDNGTQASPSCASYADTNIKDGEWNTIKVIVEGNNVTYYINDVLAIDAVVSTATGNLFVLGSNGDCGIAGNLPSFRNLVIKSNNGSVADVTAFTVTTAGPADIEVVAIAGAMIIALMAAAFVVKARKA